MFSLLLDSTFKPTIFNLKPKVISNLHINKTFKLGKKCFKSYKNKNHF